MALMYVDDMLNAARNGTYPISGQIIQRNPRVDTTQEAVTNWNRYVVGKVYSDISSPDSKKAAIAMKAYDLLYRAMEYKTQRREAISKREAYKPWETHVAEMGIFKNGDMKDLKAYFKNLNLLRLENCRVEWADLSGLISPDLEIEGGYNGDIVALANVSLKGAILPLLQMTECAIGEGVRFEDVHAFGAEFNDVGLQKLDAIDSIFDASDFGKSDMSGAKFKRSYLIGADMSLADLRKGPNGQTSFDDCYLLRTGVGSNFRYTAVTEKGMPISPAEMIARNDRVRLVGSK